MAYTQQEFEQALQRWRNGPQDRAEMYALINSTARVFNQGTGLGGSEIDAAIDAAFASNRIPAEYVSVWDGGYEVTTDCVFNIDTNEVEDVASVDPGDVEVCDGEFVRLPNGIVIKCEDGQVII